MFLLTRFSLWSFSPSWFCLGDLPLEFMLSFTTYIRPVAATLALAQSLPPHPADTSDLKSLLISYFHPQFLFPVLTPSSLVTWLVIEPDFRISSFFIVSYLCHLIYLSLLSLLTVYSSVFRVAHELTFLNKILIVAP